MFILTIGLEIFAQLLFFIVMKDITNLIVGVCNLVDLAGLKTMKILGIGVPAYDDVHKL